MVNLCECRRHLQGPRYVNVSKHVIHALTSLSTWVLPKHHPTTGHMPSLTSRAAASLEGIFMAEQKPSLNSVTQCDTLGIETKTKQYVFCHFFSGILACSSATTALPNPSSFPKGSSLVGMGHPSVKLSTVTSPKRFPHAMPIRRSRLLPGKTKIWPTSREESPVRAFSMRGEVVTGRILSSLAFIISTLHQTTPQKNGVTADQHHAKKGFINASSFFEAASTSDVCRKLRLRAWRQGGKVSKWRQNLEESPGSEAESASDVWLFPKNPEFPPWKLQFLHGFNPWILRGNYQPPLRSKISDPSSNPGYLNSTSQHPRGASALRVLPGVETNPETLRNPGFFHLEMAKLEWETCGVEASTDFGPLKLIVFSHMCRTMIFACGENSGMPCILLRNF